MNSFNDFFFQSHASETQRLGILNNDLSSFRGELQMIPSELLFSNEPFFGDETSTDVLRRLDVRTEPTILSLGTIKSEIRSQSVPPQIPPPLEEATVVPLTPPPELDEPIKRGRSRKRESVKERPSTPSPPPLRKSTRNRNVLNEPRFGLVADDIIRQIKLLPSIKHSVRTRITKSIEKEFNRVIKPTMKNSRFKNFQKSKRDKGKIIQQFISATL